MKGIAGSLVMPHEHTARALIELMKIGTASSSADPLLQHAPDAFPGSEVVATSRGQEMSPKPLMPVGQRCRQLVRPVHPPAVDDDDDLFAGGAKASHARGDILATPRGIALRPDLIEDFRRARLDRAQDTQQHPTGHATPTAITAPRWALEGFVACEVAAAEGPGRPAKALGCAMPPACSGQGKPPENGGIFLEQNARALTGTVCQGGQCHRCPRQLSGLGRERPGGTVVADGFFFGPHGRARG